MASLCHQRHHNAKFVQITPACLWNTDMHFSSPLGLVSGMVLKAAYCLNQCAPAGWQILAVQQPILSSVDAPEGLYHRSGQPVALTRVI